VSHFFKALLFWVMILLGTAALAPCLLLPAWIERQAQLEYLAARRRSLATLRENLATVQGQIDHLEHDSAYILRLAAREFGDIRIPNVHSQLVDDHSGPVTDARETELANEEPGPGQEEPLRELSAFIADAFRRYPHVRMFVDNRTRPPLMIMGGLLVLTALVLLGPVERRPRPEGEPS
jgi:hypothetical protein